MRYHPQLPARQAARERKAVEDLMMRYRIERAGRRMGKVALLILIPASIAAVASIFRPKYL